MKKLLIALALATTLTASAFAYNAPLTAAQFESGAPSENYTQKTDINKNGTLEISLETESAYLKAADADGKVYIISGREYIPYFSIPSDAFDVVAKFAENCAPDELRGYTLSLFFNPERIQVLLTENKNIYSGIVNSEGNAITKVAGLNPLTTSITYGYQGPYDKYINDNDENMLRAYNETSKYGYLSTVVAQYNAWAFNNLKDCELARWTFTETDSTDNNWYRTKIYLDFKDGDIAANVNDKISPYINGAVYYENPDYTGPKFDIVGGMKKADGELRFGSVYFTGDTYFDNQAEIVEAGIVCYPTALLDDKVLTLETEGAVKIPATGYYDDSTDSELVYTGVLSGLESAVDMYITAKSYITYKDNGGNEITVYSDPIARNLKTASTESMK